MTVQDLAAYSLANSKPIPVLAPVIRTVSAVATRAAMIAASTTSDIELLELCWEERSGIFEKDIVLTHEATTFIHKNTPMKPSAHRVGRLLCRPPFNGVPIQFRVGQKSYRGVILFNKEIWHGTSGKLKMDHIAGDDIDITQ